MEQKNQTDAELAKLSLTNPDDFGVLVERYEGKLMRYIQKLTNVNSQDGEDILQDLYGKFYMCTEIYLFAYCIRKQIIFLMNLRQSVNHQLCLAQEE